MEIDKGEIQSPKETGRSLRLPDDTKDRLVVLALSCLLWYGFSLVLGAWLNGAHFVREGGYASSLTLVLERTAEDVRLYLLLLAAIPLAALFDVLRRRVSLFVLYLPLAAALASGMAFATAGIGRELETAPLSVAADGSVTGSLSTGCLLALFILGAVLFAVHLARRMRWQEEGALPALPPIWQGALFFLYAVCAWLFSRPLLMRLCALLLGIWLLLYLLASARLGQSRFLAENAGAANLPAERVRATGRASEGILILAAVLLTGLLDVLPLERLLPYFEGAWQGVLSLLHGFFGAIPAVEEAQQSTLFDTATAASGAGLNELLPAESNPVVEALANVFGWAVLALLIFALAASVFRAVRKLMQDFDFRVSEDVTEETQSLIRKPVREDMLERRAERLPRIGGTPSQRVRRMYRRFLSGRLSAGPASKRAGADGAAGAVACATPGELEARIGVSGAEERRRLYERARYSRDGASEEDAERMKTLVS